LAQPLDPPASSSFPTRRSSDLVDRLLASPRYGERMASEWLDLARYADTHGYQMDRYRAMWPWRDWVVKAFNRKLPFDQFLTWQLDRKSTRLNSSHQIISYAVFC